MKRAIAPAGRPRSPAVRRNILAAAADLLVEVGYANVSIEQVALRAGVAKTTVYRRWTCKLDLVAAVLEEADALWPMPEPSGGDIYDDLIVLYRNWLHGVQNGGRVIPSIIAESIGNAELGELLRRTFIRPRRKLAIGLVERAIERGELPTHADPVTAIDTFMGRMWYRLLIVGEPVTLQDEHRLVHAVLDGLRAAPAKRAKVRKG